MTDDGLKVPQEIDDLTLEEIDRDLAALNDSGFWLEQDRIHIDKLLERRLKLTGGGDSDSDSELV